jgi:FPC/CPF motif-containing protein YcgG
MDNMATTEFGQQMQSNIKKKIENKNTIHPDKK